MCNLKLINCLLFFFFFIDFCFSCSLRGKKKKKKTGCHLSFLHLFLRSNHVHSKVFTPVKLERNLLVSICSGLWCNPYVYFHRVYKIAGAGKSTGNKRPSGQASLRHIYIYSIHLHMQYWTYILLGILKCNGLMGTCSHCEFLQSLVGIIWNLFRFTLVINKIIYIFIVMPHKS